jgi:hypothetical protein
VTRVTVPAPSSGPAHGEAAHRAKHVAGGASGRAREEAAVEPAPASDAEVTAKFRAVKDEYAAFKSEYGPRLEPEWNAIASEITFGRPGDRAARVNVMLDALRRHMAKVRSGG